MKTFYFLKSMIPAPEGHLKCTPLFTRLPSSLYIQYVLYCWKSPGSVQIRSMWRRGTSDAVEPRAQECPVTEACNALGQRGGASNAGPGGSIDRRGGAGSAGSLLQRMETVVKAVDRSGGRLSPEAAADALYKIVQAVVTEAGGVVSTAGSAAATTVSVGASASALDSRLLGKTLYAMHKIARAQDVSAAHAT